MANDEELAICGGPNGTAAGQIAVVGNSTTAREMAAIQIQMTNGRNGGTLVLASAVGTITTALLEAEMLGQHELCYDLGGNPGYIVVPPRVSTFIAAFAAAAGRERDFGTGRAVVNVVDLYVSPFGELDVVLDRHCLRSGQDGNVNTDGNGLFGLDFQYLATPVLRATRDFPLARTGDAENREIIRESTCAVLNTDAHFLITGIDDTLT